MKTDAVARSVGRGGATAALTAGDLSEIVSAALADVSPGARVLAIIPDRTRDDNTALLFPIVSQQLARVGAARLDALVAQGTHPPMAESDKRAKIGWGEAEIPLLGEIYDHHWDRSEMLQTIGTLPSAQVSTLTSGLLNQSVPVRLNARVVDSQLRPSPRHRGDGAARSRGLCRGREVLLPWCRRPGAHSHDALARRSGHDRTGDRPDRDTDAAHDRGGGRPDSPPDHLAELGDDA